MKQRLVSRNLATFQQITDEIYKQYRRNQANRRGNHVDVLATTQHANRLHKMIEASAKANGSMPIPVKYDEKYITFVGMNCRHYECGVLIFPNCELDVLVTKEYKSIFAIPNYESMDYMCLLRMKRFPFPTQLQPA